MKEKIAIALSGGIDSLIAAFLLKEQGHEVFGIHFITGFEAFSRPGKNTETVLPSSIDRRSSDGIPAPALVSQLSKQLDIPVEIVDIREEFRAVVVDYFVRTYQDGKTPNPCLVCNPNVKFGIVFDFAEKWGARRLATGHYAKISRDSAGRYHLYRGVDPQKEQSYFLAFMTSRHLSKACFPLEKMTKPDVVGMARDKGLTPVLSEESQDVCFIKNMTYGEFLADQTGFVSEPGAIENTEGRIIGEHKGLHLFTIGQRRGINCPAAEPYYVIHIDRERNVLVAGFKSELFSSECGVVDINWIDETPTDPIRVHTRVRYRHGAAPSTLFPMGKNAAKIKFDVPQEAVTPGQGAVFYREDEVLGGGWIEMGM
jgi:tRNA-uridine 2-sulfurtransferase